MFRLLSTEFAEFRYPYSNIFFGKMGRYLPKIFSRGFLMPLTGISMQAVHTMDKRFGGENMNHLKNQTSPYLLQHADNPVDWYPWCEEAFEKARKEDKPVFLSIGYSTCHWCHVMAEESFEDEDVARLLNSQFVSIKVDREERPDLDAVYMEVCKTMTGSGGWPMTLFLTPEQKPFFAGTYFPKNSARGMVGFLNLLASVSEAWKRQRKDLLNQAEMILSHIRQDASRQRNGKGDVSDYEKIRNLLKKAEEQMKRDYDSQYGGFGMAPKFPMGHNLLFLLDRYEQTGDEELLQMAEKTLQQMYKGGIFDHLGGGFSRYSTDPYFLVPHFEKMLYDNGLLIAAYTRGYELTGKKQYLDVAERTADWILREMQGGHGGFYSSQDADSMGEEGKFYVFTVDEIIMLLGAEDGHGFASHYGMTERGNFEGRNILNLLAHEKAEEASLEQCKEVFQYRKKRYTLDTDDKILTAWNGIAAWAFCGLYRAAGKAVYLQAAKRSIRFFLDKAGNCGDCSQLMASWRGGHESGPGFLDDYAWIISALLGLYEAEGDVDYLVKAKRFMQQALNEFFDRENGGFYLSGSKNENLLMNLKETFDGAIPSGNSVMAYNLVKLLHYSGEKDGKAFEAAAEKQMAFLLSAFENYPAGHCFYLMALSLWLDASPLYTCRDGVCAVSAGRHGKSSIPPDETEDDDGTL